MRNPGSISALQAAVPPCIRREEIIKPCPGLLAGLRVEQRSVERVDVGGRRRRVERAQGVSQGIADHADARGADERLNSRFAFRPLRSAARSSAMRSVIPRLISAALFASARAAGADAVVAAPDALARRQQPTPAPDAGLVRRQQPAAPTSTLNIPQSASRRHRARADGRRSAGRA